MSAPAALACLQDHDRDPISISPSASTNRSRMKQMLMGLSDLAQRYVVEKPAPGVSVSRKATEVLTNARLSQEPEQLAECAVILNGIPHACPWQGATLELAWALYEAVAHVAAHDFSGSPLCLEAREALPYVEQGVIDPGQWLPFSALLGIREKKAFAWLYKTTFEIETSWAAAPRPDDDLPMPRAAVLPKATHSPASDRSSDIDDLIPF